MSKFIFKADVDSVNNSDGQKQQTDTYILIFICEIGSISLVDCHDDGYDVLSIHDRCGQEVACGVFSKFVDEWAEVTIL